MSAALVSAPAGAAENEYEARAQAVVSGLARLNGLRGWTAEAPSSWPAPPSDFNRLRREAGRSVAGAVFNSDRPARLTALALVNAGLTRSADLSGLTALTALDLSGNRLDGLNLAGNEALIYLAALKNQLTTLNLSSAPRLTSLDLSGNALTRLDLSANPLLSELYLARNRLAALDLREGRRLTRLEVTGNQLTSLDISTHPGLAVVKAAYNRLTALDLSANVSLAGLDLKSNALTRLDLSRNPNLRELAAGRNRLAALDLSRSPDLTRLEVEHNRLPRLDLSQCRGLEILDASGNPLTEISLAPEAPLISLNLDGGRLPLSLLAPLTGRARDRTRFGRQSQVLFESRSLALREVLDLSAEAEFEGVPTEFRVLDEKGRRRTPSYFDQEGGRLRFNVPGRYLVEMSNPQVFSSERGGSPARTRQIKIKVVTGVVEVRP